MFRNNRTKESGPDPTFPIPIPMEDTPFHADTSPFCYDPTCLCHEEAACIEQVMQQVQEGLFTPEEASAFVAGHSLWAGESREEATQ